MKASPLCQFIETSLARFRRLDEPEIRRSHGRCKRATNPRAGVGAARRRQGWRWALSLAALLGLLSVFSGGLFLYAATVVGLLLALSSVSTAISLHRLSIVRKLSATEIGHGGVIEAWLVVHNGYAIRSFSPSPSWHFTARWLPHLARFFRRAAAVLSGLLTRFLAGLRLFGRRPSGVGAAADPFADLGALRSAEPRQAVLGAYGRMLAVFDQLGHQRPERQTPYEFLASIPGRFRSSVSSAKNLTDVYVKAAYSSSAIDAGDRQAAIEALERLAPLLK